VRRTLIEALAAVYPEGVYNDPTTWARARRLDAIALALVGDTAGLPQGVDEQASHILERLALYRHRSLAAYHYSCDFCLI